MPNDRDVTCQVRAEPDYAYRSPAEIDQAPGLAAHRRKNCQCDARVPETTVWKFDRGRCAP